MARSGRARCATNISQRCVDARAPRTPLCRQRPHLKALVQGVCPYFDRCCFLHDPLVGEVGGRTVRALVTDSSGFGAPLPRSVTISVALPASLPPAVPTVHAARALALVDRSLFSPLAVGGGEGTPPGGGAGEEGGGAPSPPKVTRAMPDAFTPGPACGEEATSFAALVSALAAARKPALQRASAMRGKTPVCTITAASRHVRVEAPAHATFPPAPAYALDSRPYAERSASLAALWSTVYGAILGLPPVAEAGQGESSPITPQAERLACLMIAGRDATGRKVCGRTLALARMALVPCAEAAALRAPSVRVGEGGEGEGEGGELLHPGWAFPALDATALCTCREEGRAAPCPEAGCPALTPCEGKVAAGAALTFRRMGGGPPLKGPPPAAPSPSTWCGHASPRLLTFTLLALGMPLTPALDNIRAGLAARGLQEEVIAPTLRHHPTRPVSRPVSRPLGPPYSPSARITVATAAFMATLARLPPSFKAAEDRWRVGAGGTPAPATEAPLPPSPPLLRACRSWCPPAACTRALIPCARRCPI
jgi:hypothetical protein